MRNIKRIDKMLWVLKKVWKQNPNLRLTQLLNNTAQSYCNWISTDLYHLEDDELIRGLLEQLEEK